MVFERLLSVRNARAAAAVRATLKSGMLLFVTGAK
jgi:hypothetical protein